MSTSSKKILACNIANLLEENNMSQSRLAELTNSTPAIVNNWIHQRCTPQVDKLDKIANAFGVTVSNLFDEKLLQDKSIEPEILKYDPTVAYTKFYKHIFGSDSTIPSEIISVTNIVAAEILLDKNWQIVRKYYNLNGYGYESTIELAKEVGVSRQRISQIISSSETKLRVNNELFFKTEQEVIRQHNTPLKNNRISDMTIDDLVERVQNGVTDSVLSCIHESFGVQVIDSSDGQFPDKQKANEIVIRAVMQIKTEELNKYLPDFVIQRLVEHGYTTLGSLLVEPENQIQKKNGIGKKSVEYIHNMKNEMFTAAEKNKPNG